MRVVKKRPRRLPIREPTSKAVKLRVLPKFSNNCSVLLAMLLAKAALVLEAAALAAVEAVLAEVEAALAEVEAALAEVEVALAEVEVALAAVEVVLVEAGDSSAKKPGTVQGMLTRPSVLRNVPRACCFERLFSLNHF